MGLDICLQKFKKVQDPTKTHREEEFSEYLKNFGDCSELPAKPSIEGLSDDYIFKCTCTFISFAKMLASKGKDIKDGWEWTGEGSSPWGVSEEEAAALEATIPPDSKTRWFVKFARTTSKDEREGVWIAVHDGNLDSFEVEEDCWVALYDGDEIGYMRKGANSRFYDDGMWDSDKIVCSKKVLKEHMEK